MENTQKSFTEEQAKKLYEKGKLFQVCKNGKFIFWGNKTACQKYLREMRVLHRYNGGRTDYSFGKLLFVPEFELTPEKAEEWKKRNLL